MSQSGTKFPFCLSGKRNKVLGWIDRGGGGKPRGGRLKVGWHFYGNMLMRGSESFTCQKRSLSDPIHLK